MNKIKNYEKYIKSYENQKISFSIKYPYLMLLFVFWRRVFRKIKNKFIPIAMQKEAYKKYINVRNQSTLMRKLWNIDMKLQKNKLKNLEISIRKLNGLIIKPWEVFSFWEIVWKPTYKKWYLDGMLISKWKVISWVWWWLCQLSNLLYWMFFTQKHWNCGKITSFLWYFPWFW